MEKPVIEIELNEAGIGTVKIDGHNIAHAACRATIQTEPGKPAHVTLDLWAHHLKVKLPATFVAEVREAMTPDDEVENRVVERVLTVFDTSKLADEVLKIINARMGRMRP